MKEEDIKYLGEEFIEEAKKVGFTDEQLVFLGRWLMFASEEDRFLQF